MRSALRPRRQDWSTESLAEGAALVEALSDIIADTPQTPHQPDSKRRIDGLRTLEALETLAPYLLPELAWQACLFLALDMQA